MDVITAESSTMTVLGTLAWSRAASGALTMVGGDLTVGPGGNLDMGTAASPIPNGIFSYLLAAYGSVGGQYGIVIADGGNFTARGFARNMSTTLSANVSAGATSVSVPAGSLTGWFVGDGLIVAQTARSSTNDSDLAVVTGASGAGPITVTLDRAFAHAHSASGPLPGRVENISRNVIITSSGSTLSSAGYLRSLASAATGFFAAYAEFSYLGTSAAGASKRGVVLEGAGAAPTVSSSSFHNNYVGLVLSGANGAVLTGNTVCNNSDAGLIVSGAGANSLYGNVTCSNSGDPGLWLQSDTAGGVVTGGVSYSNSYGMLVEGSGHAVSLATAAYNTGAGVHLTGTSHSLRRGTALGNNLNGVNILGSDHLVSSNAVTSNYIGLYCNAAVRSSVTANDMGSNTEGLELDNCSRTLVDNNRFHDSVAHGALDGNGSQNRFLANVSSSNAGVGIWLTGGQRRVLAGNVVSGNGNVGVFVQSDDNTLTGNQSSSNTLYGFRVSGTGNILSGNVARNNGNTGVFIDGSADDNVLLGQSTYQNGNGGLRVNGASGNVCVDCRLGYSTSSLSAADRDTTLAEVSLNSSLQSALVLRNTRVNPTVAAVDSASLSLGNSVLTQLLDQAAGETRVYGDYLVTGSSLALHHSSNTYASSAGAPRLMVGDSHAAAVCATSDADALAQTVSVTRAGGVWVVSGSSSGALGSFAGALGACTGFPAGTPQFTMTFTPGASPAEGDVVDFALYSASRDQAVQKKLLFAGAAPSFNGGRARLVAPAGLGLDLVGAAGAPTLVDRLDASATYYTLVDSGTFRAVRTTITNTDPDGLQLSGSGPVVLSSVTFDSIGFLTSSTATYVTARALTSSALFDAVAFDATRPSADLHNVTVTGTDSGLSWQFGPSASPVWGKSRSVDPNDRVNWGVYNPLPLSPPLTMVGSSSAAVRWGASLNGPSATYTLQASTAADFTGTLVASATANAFATLEGLAPNTTYHHRVRASDGGNVSAWVALASTSTLTVSLSAVAYPYVFTTSVAANWSALPAAPQAATAEGYRLEASTSADFSPSAASSATVGVTLATLAVSGLTPATTYWLRVGGVNWDGVAGFGASAAAAHTRAATPASPAVAAVAPADATGKVGVILSWNEQGNPAAVPYEVSYSTVTGFAAAVSTPISFGLGFTADSSLISDLLPNTTHHFRVRGRDGVGTAGDFSATVTTLTVAAVPGALPYGNVTLVSVSANWTANANPAGTRYLVELSSSPAFAWVYHSSLTANTAAAFSGLLSNVAYSGRVRAVDGLGRVSALTSLGSVLTNGASAIQINSATHPASTWKNTTAAQFTGSGADHFRYKFATSAGDLPTASDALWDLGATPTLSTTVPFAAAYFNVLGQDAANDPVGYLSFGPILVDTGAVVMAAIQGQVSAVDTTVILPDVPAVASTPRFLWSASTAASGVAGYSYSVSADSTTAPDDAVDTAAAFFDYSFPTTGVYYVKAKAVSVAGSTSAAAGFVYRYTAISGTSVVPKRNLFNPLRGEATTVSLSLSASGRVRIVLYDPSGRPVKTLHDGDLPRGLHDFPWTGRNEGGQVVASGAYILRVEAPGFRQERAVVIVK